MVGGGRLRPCLRWRASGPQPEARGWQPRARRSSRVALPRASLEPPGQCERVRVPRVARLGGCPREHPQPDTVGVQLEQQSAVDIARVSGFRHYESRRCTSAPQHWTSALQHRSTAALPNEARTETASSSSHRRAARRIRRSRRPRHMTVFAARPRRTTCRSAPRESAGETWPRARASSTTPCAPPGPSAPCRALPSTQGSHSYICDTCASSACDLLVDHVVDRDRDVGTERIRLLEAVLEVHEDRVLPQRRHVGHDVGHRHHEGRVLHAAHRCSGDRDGSRSAGARGPGPPSTGGSAG